MRAVVTTPVSVAYSRFSAHGAHWFAELEWTLQPGLGRLVAQTILHHSYERFFQERLPWRLGLVRLEGGPTVVTHLHSRVPAPPAAVQVTARLDQSGQAVLIALVPGGEDAMNDDPNIREITWAGRTGPEGPSEVGSPEPEGSRTEACRKSQPVALLTGGSSGIGAATCRSLLAAGYQVISLDRNPGRIESPHLQEVQVDLTDAEATRTVAAQLARQFRITTVVHNAGAVRQQPLELVSAEDLETLTHLHIAAPIALVQANLATMKAQHFGRVILISTRAVLGLANRTVYSATKAAMLGMARTWALELGAHGITANVIAPGPIEATDVFHDIIPRDSPKLPAIIESIPVKRLGRPEDVARAVMFFAASEAGFVTGQTLFVCGGTSVGSIVY
jgi:3-oxoacyl-[acyl-carrier protein] reductase